MYARFQVESVREGDLGEIRGVVPEVVPEREFRSQVSRGECVGRRAGARSSGFCAGRAFASAGRRVRPALA